MPEPYTAHIEPAAQRDLDRLDDRTAARVVDAFARLREDPRHRGTQKLRGAEGQWRARGGDYRVLYEIEERERLVRVFRVAHRREAYR